MNVEKNIYQTHHHSRPQSQRLIDWWMKMYCSFWKEDWRKSSICRRLRQGRDPLCNSKSTSVPEPFLSGRCHTYIYYHKCFPSVPVIASCCVEVSVSHPGFLYVCRVMEYSLDGHNASLSAIRTVRVLRPLRAINRVPSKVLTESLNTSILNECAQTVSSPFTNEKTHHKQWIKASSRCSNTSFYLTVDNCSASH